jgi:23S rRNA (guanosine2251-2'-O)-methyltransferase
MDRMIDENYVYGRNPIMQLLSEENPKISKVFFSFSASGGVINKIMSEAKKNKIAVSKMDNRKFKDLEKRIGCEGSESQGVIALKALVEVLEDFELFEKALQKEEYPIIVALDSIEDPHNLVRKTLLQ